MKKWYWIISVIALLAVIILFKFSFVKIPDNTMLPKFEKGELVLVKKTKLKRKHRGYSIAYHDPAKSDIRINQKKEDISRIIAFPGDTLLIYNKEVFVNSDKLNNKGEKLYNYRLSVNENFDISSLSVEYFSPGILIKNKIIEILVTPANKKKIKKKEGVKNIRITKTLRGKKTTEIFPDSQYKKWNKDFFGPLVIPQKGQKIELDYKNIELYRRLISVFEGHNLYTQHRNIMIDGEQTNKFYPEKDYYFVLDDNRDAANDSRYFGFIPEDHIVGTVVKRDE